MQAKHPLLPHTYEKTHLNFTIVLLCVPNKLEFQPISVSTNQIDFICFSDISLKLREQIVLSEQMGTRKTALA